jgi:hypothetical protein
MYDKEEALDADSRDVFGGLSAAHQTRLRKTMWNFRTASNPTMIQVRYFARTSQENYHYTSLLLEEEQLDKMVQLHG